MSEADMRKDITVDQYIDSLDEKTADDARVLLEMFGKISDEKPILYGFGTIGFGIYHYKYDSGREGDAHTIGYYPRKSKITVYLMDGTTRYSKLLDKLGKHTITGYCIYIKQLSDVDLKVLEQIVKESYNFITSKYKSGPIGKIMWQTEK